MVFQSYLQNADEIKIIRVRNMFGKDREVYEVTLENREVGRHVRREFGLALKATPCPIKKGISLNNALNPSSRVRVSVLKVSYAITVLYGILCHYSSLLS